MFTFVFMVNAPLVTLLGPSEGWSSARRRLIPDLKSPQSGFYANNCINLEYIASFFFFFLKNITNMSSFVWFICFFLVCFILLLLFSVWN